jgi:hypothetical protein
MCGMFKYRLYYAYFKKMKRISLLDYVEYDKSIAENILKEKFGWEKYKNKHYENIFTRFYEGYYLPKKFGFDKRKVYYSNMILTGQISREKALIMLEESPYSEELMLEDSEYIAKKLGLNTDSFLELINLENRDYTHYKNSLYWIEKAIKIAKILGVEKRNFR